MMNSTLKVFVTCDLCGNVATLEEHNPTNTSTMDSITWRVVRDLVLTSAWHRVSFPDASTFREYHVCSMDCAQRLAVQQYKRKGVDEE